MMTIPEFLVYLDELIDSYKENQTAETAKKCDYKIVMLSAFREIMSAYWSGSADAKDALTHMKDTISALGNSNIFFNEIRSMLETQIDAENAKQNTVPASVQHVPAKCPPQTPFEAIYGVGFQKRLPVLGQYKPVLAQWSAPPQQQVLVPHMCKSEQGPELPSWKEHIDQLALLQITKNVREALLILQNAEKAAAACKNNERKLAAKAFAKQVEKFQQRQISNSQITSYYINFMSKFHQ